MLLKRVTQDVSALCKELQAALHDTRAVPDTAQPAAYNGTDAAPATTSRRSAGRDSTGMEERCRVLEEANQELTQRLDMLGPDFWEHYESLEVSLIGHPNVFC